MENNIVSPSSGSYKIVSSGTALGKRKLKPIDLPEFSWPEESPLKDNRGTTHEFTAAQTKYDNQFTLQHQFLGDKFYYKNDTTEMRLTGNMNFQRFQIEYSNSMPLSNGLQPLKHEEQFQSLEVQTGERPELPSWMLENGNICGKSEYEGSPSVPSYTSNVDTAPRDPIVQDTALTKRLLATLCADDLSETRRAVGTFQQSSSQPDCSNVLSDKRTSVDEVSMFDTPCSFGLRGNLFQTIKSNNAPSKACADQKEIQTEGHSKVRDTERFIKEKKKSSLIDKFASRHGHNPNKSFVREKQKKSNHVSHRLEEKSRSKLDKLSLAAEKIWDGSLKLNSSMTVPAVAFFKSGEKLLDVNWSEFVDVKGKVRLEAFEKYIQELSRSRNRGLMVISLCCSEVSETGIKHMKEVAKGYIKGVRVGFARISPGVDLYLCPRTNTIITILAKHGFFKGMAAIESKSELFIGCVVWRKNHTASASVAKMSESKTNSQSEQLQKSPSDSIDVPTVDKSSLSSVDNAQSLPSAKSSSVADNNDIKDNKNTGVDNSSSNTISLPTLTYLERSPSPVEQQESVPSKSQLQGTPWHVLISGTHYAEPATENKEHSKYSASLPSNTWSQKRPFNDDDLPEFDFGNAGAISVSSDGESPDASVLNRNRTEDGSGKLTGYVAHSVPLSKETFNDLSVSKPAASTTNVDAPPPREVGVHGLSGPLPRQMEGGHAYESHGTLPTVGTRPCASPKIRFADSRKKIFFDDDDIPEWLPPDLQKQSFAKGSNIPANPGLKNLPFHHHPSRSLPHFPTPAPNPPEFSSLAVSPVLHPPSPPVPSRDGPSYMTGFTFNPVLQPTSGPLAVKSPLQPADGVWRP